MTTKTTTKAQIQSQLEEARFTIDRMRGELEGHLDALKRKEEHIASLKLQLEEMGRRIKPEENESLKDKVPTTQSAWERIKKEWRRCDAKDYYKFASLSPGAMTLAFQAQLEMTQMNRRMYVSTVLNEVYVAVRK